MQGNVTRFIAALAAGVLAGCAAMGPRIEGWPVLAVHEHHVPHAEMRERCARYSGFGAPPLACAEVNFSELRCDVWFSADFPPSTRVREHERMHCAGHDHENDDTLRAALAEWRRQLALIARHP
jgi:hypothetical protein